ncbi:type II secretion system protein N [Dyella subtropica]|uniref:type II secretion system protein N n=1 Tax=Dyella subtropica TaxID=2992127 RepID=UPI002259AF0D|nr:type II secretion system protein N [Dyella subtropica]
MNRSRAVLAFVALLLLAALLVAFLPARWVKPQLEARLHGLRLEGVSGTLWQGHADKLLAVHGDDLGRLDWQLSRRALLGDTQLGLALVGPAGHFSGQMRKLDAQRVEWSQLHVESDLVALTERFLPQGTRLRGTLAIDGGRAVLQGRWPVELDAQAHWNGAQLLGQDRTLDFGNLQLQASGEGGVVQGSLQDDGNGPLQLAGQFDLSPLGWHYDIKAKPRQPDPALSQWLAGFGPMGADGTMHLKRRGGIAAGSSKERPSKEHPSKEHP